MMEHSKQAPERTTPPGEDLPAALLEDLPRVDLPPGSELVLEFEGVYGHLKSELIGYHEGHYLLIRTPVGPPGFSARLFRGNSLVVRYLDEGRACGFQTAILHTVTEPEPLLFIGCPRLMQQKSLRSAQRLDTYVVCKAAVQNRTVDGTLIDVSRHGWRCILPTHLPDGTLRPLVGERIVITADLGGTVLRIAGVVRNLAHFPASVRLGCEFDGNDRATEEHILEFLVREGVQG